MDQNAIVGAALDLLNETGLDGLTVRRLAERLQVKNPALYWHFPSKRALLDEMAQMLQSRQDFGPPHEGESWQQWLARRGRDRRRVLLSCRDAARLVAGTRAGPALIEKFEAELHALVTAGFTPGQALHAVGTITRYVNGFVLDEQAMASHAAEGAQPPAGADFFRATPTLAAAIREAGDSDAAFDEGLQVLIAGIAARRGRRTVDA
ncbi:TetR/AcrR family transcriptional regulator C-terminal domain-containing protein [Dactylosporangium sp. CA-139066]|uniref:TetR/AcrR family transcriptional regulator C-terminal domain-containing protein n=1 Tax=Dactylosporangium sp. CA-139066 TaxID=3239930 RepID=UPI003D91F115